MSGGALGYTYTKIYDAAETICVRATCPEHKAFANHLKKVAKALHDIEWVFSGDTVPGNEMASIMNVISSAQILEEALKDAKEAYAHLADAIKEAFYEVRRSTSCPSRGEEDPGNLVGRR
jgi:uncharacterized membrane protein YfbV (UPF0208 family)